jgi:hypothetical protein
MSKIRYCKLKSSGVILESQSGGDENDQSYLEGMVENALSSGCLRSDIEVGWEEIAVIQQWEQDSMTANEVWEKNMRDSDNGMMPRYAEDILDGMDKSGVAQILLDRLQSKKDLRAAKP